MAQNNQFPIIDGHNDTLLDLHSPKPGVNRTFFSRSEHGHLDLPRALDGGFAGGFFAIFVPNETTSQEKETLDQKDGVPEGLAEPTVGIDYAQRTTAEMIRLLRELEAESNDRLVLVRDVIELTGSIENNKIAAILHFEGAECIEPDLSNLESYYKAGLRSLGITWSRSNAFGSGVPFKHPHSPDTGPGLTAAGKQLVKACNRLGIMIDLSHLNEKGFWDVQKISVAPLVATHSAAHHICPSTRNLTDDQIDAIGQSGGLIGINFHVGFIRPDGESDPNTPLTDIVRHLDHIVGRIGINHVALGSDFDGALMPSEMKDVSGLPQLVATLQGAGYSDLDLKKITHENWLRVLRETW